MAKTLRVLRQRRRQATDYELENCYTHKKNRRLVFFMNEKHPNQSKILDSGCCVSPMELAQAYVCPQKLGGVFPPEEGLKMGTIFPDLFKPYEGGLQR
jgi:hypothetical protein